MYFFVHSVSSTLKSYYLSHITKFTKLLSGQLIQISRIKCSVTYCFVCSLTFFLKSYYFPHISAFSDVCGKPAYFVRKNSNLTLPNPLLAKRGNQKYGS